MNISEIEALFPLSPLQRWMLASQTKGSLRTGEIVLEADRRLDPAVLRAAWNKLVGNNPGMRTAFAWKRVKHPLQFVRRVTTAGVEECDGFSCKLDAQHNRYETAQPGPADVLALNEPASDISPSEVPQWRVYLCCCSDSSYRLVFRYSRIAFDRLSARLLLGELFLTYDRLCGRTRDNEPKRPAFRDYIAAIAGEPDSAAGQFWRGRLEGLRSPTHLAIEQQKSDAGNRHGPRLTHSIEFAPEDNDRLRRVTERISVHPRTLLHGAWAILLSRYSDTRDIVYGAVVPGRAAIIEGLDSMIGPFLNVLPVRTWIPGDRAFAPWLFELDSQLSGLDAYDYCSPDQVGGADGLGDETQLFRYVIDHDENPVIDDRSNLLCEEVGVRVSDETPAWEYPLTLRSRSAEALDASLIFDPSYYEPEDVGRLASSLRTLLLAIVEDPNRPISSIPIFSRTEAHQILVEWNECGSGVSENPSIEEMLHGVIEQSPESIAVSEAGSQLTYSRLEECAQRIAGYLRQIGVGPEFLVGVLALPSIEVIACLIGILRAGGAFLPLDPDYPMDRLSFMLRDANVHLLMGHSELLDQLPAFGGVTVSIDREWSVTNEYGGYAWRNAPIPQSLAYVIYTSGSTGEPKGVMVERRGITNLCESQAVGFEIGRDSRVVQFFSLGFDASVSEIFVTLLNGARLVMIQGRRTRMGDELIDLMRAEQITAVTLPPSLLSVLEADGLPALRTVVSAGEACKAEIVQRWGRGRKFVNAYGPTETTVCASLGECGSADGIPAIGRPISRTKMYLLDRDMNPAPYGVPGEVFIAGIGVARGYVRRPSLTAEKFIPNPTAQGEWDRRLYRTGDLATRCADGKIEYVGRIDNQVKVRGHRIELEEIEAALTAHPFVRDAVAVARQSDSGLTLTAYVVTRNDESLRTEEIKAYLKRIVPEFMLPASYVFLDSLPVTTSGKVDRRKLPEPGLSQAGADRPFEPACTDLEQGLAEIWRDILGIESVGIRDNFFEIGGHSLLGAQMFSRIKDRFAVKLPLGALFDSPTIAGLAVAVGEARVTSRDESLMPINQLPRGGESIEELLAKISKMSESDAQAILQQRVLLAKGREGK